MTRITVELSDEVAARLRAEAERAGDEFEVYPRHRIESLPVADPLWGFMGDSDLVDQLLENIMSTRETQTLRVPSSVGYDVDQI